MFYSPVIGDGGRIPNLARFQPVRALALADGKLLFMAVPRLAEPHPFLRLDLAALGEQPERYTDRTAAARKARPTRVDEMPVIDFIVCGSVAVNPEGVRMIEATLHPPLAPGPGSGQARWARSSASAASRPPARRPM